jgi:hypothetical protein
MSLYRTRPELWELATYIRCQEEPAAGHVEIKLVNPKFFLINTIRSGPSGPWRLYAFPDVRWLAGLCGGWPPSRQCWRWLTRPAMTMWGWHDHAGDAIVARWVVFFSWVGWIKVDALGFLSCQDEDPMDACPDRSGWIGMFRKALPMSSIGHIMSGDCWFGGFGHAHPSFFYDRLVLEGARRSSVSC